MTALDEYALYVSGDNGTVVFSSAGYECAQVFADKDRGGDNIVICIISVEASVAFRGPQRFMAHLVKELRRGLCELERRWRKKGVRPGVPYDSRNDKILRCKTPVYFYGRATVCMDIVASSAPDGIERPGVYVGTLPDDYPTMLFVSSDEGPQIAIHGSRRTLRKIVSDIESEWEMYTRNSSEDGK